jgi:putative transcriptional regulator
MNLLILAMISIMASASPDTVVTRSSLKNHFLIALRNLREDYFSNTVTYIIEHTDEGAFGVIINRPIELDFCDLFASIPGINKCLLPVLDGGPVGKDSVFFLHGSDVKYQYTQALGDDINLTTSQDLVNDLVAGTGPSRVLTLLGYAGWDGGQLELELAENVWLVSPADSAIIFDVPYEKRPESAAGLLGIDLHLVSTNVGHG